MKQSKSILKSKKWFLPLLLLIPNILLAQHLDSASYKKHKFYYFGDIEAGVGYGKIDLYQVPPNGLSGGPGFLASATVSVDHYLLTVRTTSYGILFSSPYLHSATYDIMIGRFLPVGPKQSFSIATGASVLKYFYQSQTTTFPYTASTGLTTALGVPVELKYNFKQIGLVGAAITYTINFNNTAVVSGVTFGAVFGKVRETRKGEYDN